MSNELMIERGIGVLIGFFIGLATGVGLSGLLIHFNSKFAKRSNRE